jgi:cell division protein FtsQ
MTQSWNRTRPLDWEEEEPAEPRSRRQRKDLPSPANVLENAGADEDSSPFAESRKSEDRFGGSRFGRPRRYWWRPASAAGRVFLLLLTLALLGGFATSAYLLKSYLDRDARFRVAGMGNIDVSGLTEVSRAQMMPIFNEDIGRSIFFLPLAERRRQLEAIPWVEWASVMRLLPNQIRVEVVERQPVAFARQGDQFGLVDANGVLLTMPPAMMAQRHFSFPVVTGINAADSPATRQARMAVYQRLLAELDANGQKLSEQVSEIDLTDSADARVLMPEQGGDILAHFGEDRFLERYQRYKAHINEWRKQYPKLAAVDLRYEQQAVLVMQPGTNVAQAAADEQHAATTSDVKPTDGRAAGDSGEKHSAAAKAPVGHTKSVAKPKTTAPKAKTVKVKAKDKKRTQAKRVALKVSRQRVAPSAGEGQ